MKVLKNGYECKKNWPKGCSVQGDHEGIVFSSKGCDKTAFFEAFPEEPNDTFIRGEGKTLAEAEANAFLELEGYLACPGHEYERHDERGSGVCKHCAIKKTAAFESACVCSECGGGDASIGGEGTTMLCANCYYKVEAMGQYYAAKNGALKPKEGQSEESFWAYISYNVLRARTYYMLKQDGGLSGLNTYAIKRVVDDYCRRDRLSHTMLQDVAISYLLKYAGGEDIACFFTQTLAYQLLSDPTLNDRIVSYHKEMRTLLDNDREADVSALDNQLNAVVRSYVERVLEAGNLFHMQKDKPEGLVRARTRKEKESAIGDVLNGMFAALTADDNEDEENEKSEEGGVNGN
jgi:hypothetical protein